MVVGCGAPAQMEEGETGGIYPVGPVSELVARRTALNRPQRVCRGDVLGSVRKLASLPGEIVRELGMCRNVSKATNLSVNTRIVPQFVTPGWIETDRTSARKKLRNSVGCCQITK